MCRWALVLLVLWPGAAAAQRMLEGSVAGREDKGFGRIVFSFPEPVTATARAAGGVLIVSFDRPVRLSVEKLAASMPGYIGAVRVDPDQMSLRLAVTQPLRTDLKDAAEQLYLDLLPASWRGAPPALPLDVSADLARRARTMREAMAQVAQQKARPMPLPLRIATAESETRWRIALSLPAGVSAQLRPDIEAVDLEFSGPVLLDAAALRAALSGIVSAVEVEPKEGGGHLRFAIPPGVVPTGEDEDGVFVVDIPKPPVHGPAAPVAKPATESKDAPAVKTAANEPAAKEPAAKEPAGKEPAGKEPAAAASVPEAARARPAAAVAGGSEILRVSLAAQGNGLRLTLSPRLPVAVFERGGIVHVVARGTRAVQVTGQKLSALAQELEGVQNDGWSHVRLVPAQPGLLTVSGHGEGWAVDVLPTVESLTEPIRFQRGADKAGRRYLAARLAQAGEPVWLDNLDSGERIGVFPLVTPVRAVVASQHFAEFELLSSAQGVAVHALADDLVLKAELEMVSIQREAGLSLSDEPEVVQAGATPADLLLPAEQWNGDRRGTIRDTARQLLSAAADAPRRARTPARLRLAEFQLANGFAEEAQGILGVVGKEDPGAAVGRHLALLAGLAAIGTGDLAGAGRALAHGGLASEPEAALFRAYLDVKARRYGPALATFRLHLGALDRAAEVHQALLRPAVIDAALQAGDTYLASRQLGDFEQLETNLRDPGLISLLSGRIAEAAGNPGEALLAFQAAATSQSRPVEAEGRLSAALAGLALGQLAADRGIAELETVAMIWRRSEIEVRARAKLADMMAAAGQWRDAFSQSRRAVEILPDHPLTHKMQDEAARQFAALFLEGRDARLDKVQALAIFDEFRWLIPPGSAGDDIVLRLAERLFDLDLVEQASDLMDHQVANRLKGLPRARAAIRLSVMHLVNAKPQQALNTLRTTRQANLPPEMKRARLMLEARALAELSRGDLALEVIGAEGGVEAERLRADIHWRARRWDIAAETYERALGLRWQEGAALSDIERSDVMRAGIAYVLASDRLGTDRLRTKFLGKMADSVDAEAFKLVTLDHLSRPDAFRTLARGAVSGESLGSFLDAYRKRFAAGAPKEG